jgi:putative ATPase
VLEQAALWALNHEETEISEKAVEESLSSRVLRYDRNGDGHFQVISAFIKSMRGSDPDAAIYYMCRMLDAGEDPLFILRRVVIFASEDIGNADPRALTLAVSALQAFQSIGLPEGAIPMAQAVTYCASAPKSNASYQALNEARAAIQDTGSLPVPKHIINAPTSLAKSMGHGEGYDYPHNHPGGFVSGVEYLPEKLTGNRFYRPRDFGFEKYIRERLVGWHGPWEE